MESLSHEALQDILHDVLVEEGVELTEVVNRVAKRLATGTKPRKRLTPSKYLKKYGNRWHNLKEDAEELSEELNPAPREDSPSLAHKYTKKNKETAEVRRVGIDGTLHEAKGMTPTKAKKEERIAKNRDLDAKHEMRTSSSGVPHTASGKRMTFEEVIPAKGNKKDKRADVVAKELPTMPAGMNAGMRMMPEEILHEISRDKIYGAYKERYTLAKAHTTVGNKAEAEKNAHKALKHAEYHAGYNDSREKYAKIASARAEIAKRAKKVRKEEPASEKKSKATPAPEPKKKGASKKSTPKTPTTKEE